jgi:hypothetical protein
MLRGVSMCNEAFSSDQQLQCGIGLSPPPSAVDEMAVVLICRAVGRSIPDRVGNRGPSCPTTDTCRTVGHLNSCFLS